VVVKLLPFDNKFELQVVLDLPQMGDVHVNLTPKNDRKRASHAIALDIRKRLKDLRLPPHASLKVVEVPPGPPVLSTVLAEVYGPDATTHRATAAGVRKAAELAGRFEAPIYGEWEIAYVTFRDMGAAFGVAILGIYLLVVAQFGSFTLPLVVLTPVPLTLIGIVLGHWEALRGPWKHRRGGANSRNDQPLRPPDALRIALRVT
jgi:multidrug efflux pump subunit AcrB